MRGLCPHCGDVNEYSRPPATAIVYCQKCRKPFGAASLVPDTGQGAQKARQATGSKVPQGQPLAAPSRPKTPAPRAAAPAAAAAGSAGSASRGTRPAKVDDTKPPAEDTRPPIQPERPVAAKVIVPKLVSKSKSDASAPPKARLVYLSAESLETDFELEELNSIGRHPRNTIRLHDREVSKEHAVVEKRSDQYFIRDLDSSNGTFVNNRRIRQSELSDGDELLLGSMRLKFYAASSRRASTNEAKELVTILPNEPVGATHVHATLGDSPEEHDFRPANEVQNPETLKQDYEKLRVAYELSRSGVSLDLKELLERTLEVAFSVLPADNGVILLIDSETGVLSPHTVKHKESAAKAQEIVLSHTIINQVLNDRTSILLSDAFLDPRFSGAQSIISQGIRSAMCVPLVANSTVYGVMHLDSRQRIGAFTEKDLQLLKSLANQAAIAIWNSRLMRRVEEDARTRGQLSRFLPPHVVEQMVQGKGQTIIKGGRECQAAVLFCDIRGFTAMSEAAGGPQDIVALLNDYFERLVEVVFRRHGVLDKFIGDALMAHWGTLERDQDSSFEAVAAALDFRDAIRTFNEERAAEGLPPIGMGVGVNTGRLVAGYMGAKRRLEYTVIGDTVNTASRLCGLAQADQVLISQDCYRQVADRIEAQYLGSRQVKGKEQGVEVYEAFAIRESMSETGS